MAEVPVPSRRPMTRGSLYKSGCGPELNGDCTDVVDGHEASLPSWSCGFDSRHPLRYRCTPSPFCEQAFACLQSCAAYYR